MKRRHNVVFPIPSVKLDSDYPNSIKTLQADSLFYVLLNKQIWKPCDMKLHHYDVITKNNRKIRASEKPVKLFIIRKFLTKAIQKCSADQIRATLSNVVGI